MSSGAEELSMETAVVLEASAPSTADFEHKLLELDGKKAETDHADDEDLASSASSVSSASSSSSTSSVQPSAPSLAASLAVDSVPSPGSNDRAACEPQSSSSGDAYEPQQQPQLGLAVDGHVMMVMAPSAQLLDAGFGGAGGGRPRADTVMSEEDENELDADVCGDDYVDGDAQLMTRVRLGTLPNTTTQACNDVVVCLDLSACVSCVGAGVHLLFVSVNFLHRIGLCVTAKTSEDQLTYAFSLSRP
jgi:hypothetical protein